MASLTETAYYTRRAVNWGILAVIAYIILRALWSITSTIWLAAFPPKAPPPTHAFGRLPALNFPQQASPSAALEFRLETIEGTVPKASESARVYFMPKSAANLLAIPSKTQTAKASIALMIRPLPFGNSGMTSFPTILSYDISLSRMRAYLRNTISLLFLLQWDLHETHSKHITSICPISPEGPYKPHSSNSRASSLYR